MGVATTTIARLFLLPLLIAVHGNRALRCDEGPLERREEQANIVLTGTVGKLYGDPAGGKYMCEVEVKRVFKGRGDVLNLLEGPQHNTIMIGGFGNPALCHSDVRERDTRIFLLAKDGKSLSLNSSLVRMTLNNLKHSEAAVEAPMQNSVDDECKCN
ncbi:PREDICTED: agrin-like, partial [Priapulus caudatus]|uniref:Agrin-like n=1 Tax=Priapulus caudatus TaxID=37621 RepID=A0ABM1E821_PRICU